MYSYLKSVRANKQEQQRPHDFYVGINIETGDEITCFCVTREVINIKAFHQKSTERIQLSVAKGYNFDLSNLISRLVFAIRDMFLPLCPIKNKQTSNETLIRKVIKSERERSDELKF